MMTESERYYNPVEGFSSNLFATRDADEKLIVIGGQAADETQWAFTLTRRAAQSLWYEMTRLLFPEKSDEVLGQVTTMRSIPRLGKEVSPVTTHAFVSQLDDGGCKIEGWIGKPGWRVQVDAYEIYRFWAALDSALYPTGW